METLIRLATAHAKARLSSSVERADAVEAEIILRFALFKEVPKRQRRKKRKLNDGNAVRKGEGSGSDESESGESGDEADQPNERMSMPPQAPRNPETQDPIWGEDSQDVQMSDAPLQAPPPAVGSNDGRIRPER